MRPLLLQAELDAQRERCELLQESMQRLEAELAPDEPPGLPFMLRGRQADGKALARRENGDGGDSPAAAPVVSAGGNASTLAAANSALTRKVIQLSEHFSRRAPWAWCQAAGRA